MKRILDSPKTLERIYEYRIFFMEMTIEKADNINDVREKIEAEDLAKFQANIQSQAQEKLDAEEKVRADAEYKNQLGKETDQRE